MKIHSTSKAAAWAIRPLFALLIALSLAGCASKNSMQADILNSNSQGTNSTTGNDSLSQNSNVAPFPVLNPMSGQKALYDKAYEKEKPYVTPQSPVRGAVMAANLKSKEEIAGFFDRLQKGQQYEEIVLLNAVNFQGAPTPGHATPPYAMVGDYGYKTPYGIVPPPGNFAFSSPVPLLTVDMDLAKREPWPRTMAPFIAKSFPDAKVLTVFMGEDASAADKQKLADWLNTNLPENTLVIAQTTPKTSQEKSVADYQLQFAKNVLENFDAQKLQTLPLNNTATVDVLEKYLAQRKAQKMQTQFMDSATGSFISFSMDGPVSQSRSVFLVSFGDIMLDRVVRSLMDSHSLDYPFEKMDESYLKNNDILLANLEGPIAKKRAQTSKSIAFRFNPDVVPLLQKYSFDALGEANNHAADMGWTGFNDTFDLLAPAGIKVFGNPKEIEDRSVATFDIQGQKIAFLGLEEVVYAIDDKKAVDKIKDLTAQGYKVIPFMHWGIEYRHKPDARQIQLAHEFVDAGAVAIIGAHPHVVQTYETYKNRPIFYSLGNGIFDQYFSPDTQEGLSIAMNIANDRLEIYFFPIKIDRSQFRLMNPEERKKFLEKFVTWGDYPVEADRQAILNGKLTLKL